MLKNLNQAFKLKISTGLYSAVLLNLILLTSAQAQIGISTPTVNSGELIRASDWNKVKLDLETIAAAVGGLQNQSWDSSGSDTFYDAGNVGIGLNSPAATLHLFADTPAANAVLLQLGTTDDPDRVRIDEDGDMTIDGKLVVRDSDIYESGGDLELSGEDSLYLSMDWNNNDGDNQNIFFGKNSDGAGVNFVELMRLTEAGDLGVGVAAPLSKMHIAGAVQIGGDAAPCVPSKSGALRYDSGAVERCDGANWDALATTNVSDNMGTHIAEQNLDLDSFVLVGAGGTEGISINAAGEIGIGTINPTSIVDIVNDAESILNVRTTAINGEDSAITITGAQTTSTTADIASLRLFNKDGAPFEGARIALRNGDFNDSTSLGDLVFLTNTGSADSLSEKMRILDSGAVGIGTSGPVAQLQVQKSGAAPNEIVFQVGANSDLNRFSVDEDGDVFNDGNYYVGGGNVIANNGGLSIAAEDNLYFSADWDNNDADNRSIIFGKNGIGGGGGFEELARFNENGRLGINENNPANILHIGDTEINDRIAVIENLATSGSPESLLVLTGQGAGPGANFAVGTGTESSHTKKFVVTNAGNVGIGTQNPLHLLQLEGGNTVGAFGSLTLNNAPFRILDGASSNLYMDGNSIITASAPFLIGTSDNNSLNFGTNNVSRITVASGGNVGIGTTSPEEKLHVDGNIQFQNGGTLMGKRPTGASMNLISTGVGANNDSIILGESTSVPNEVRIMLPIDSGQGLNILNDTTSIAFFENNGNVGIGTTSPAEKLEIVGTVKATALNLDLSNNGTLNLEATGVAGAKIENPDGALGIESSGGILLNSAAITLNVGGINSFYINSARDVGIGEDNPQAKLHVDGETRLTGVSADGVGKLVCIKADQNLGTCTNAPNGSGVCSCS